MYSGLFTNTLVLFHTSVCNIHIDEIQALDQVPLPSEISSSEVYHYAYIINTRKNTYCTHTHQYADESATDHCTDLQFCNNLQMHFTHNILLCHKRPPMFLSGHFFST